jgi:hypothetical protein
MYKLLASIQHVREVQAELIAKERQFHAAIASGDDPTVRNLQGELTELFRRSDAAFAEVRAEFERIDARRAAKNEPDF